VFDVAFVDVERDYHVSSCVLYKLIAKHIYTFGQSNMQRNMGLRDDLLVS